MVLALLTLVLSSDPAGESPAGPRYADHSKLLRVLDSDGLERPVRSLSDWKLRRRHILLAMEEVMGEFGRPPEARGAGKPEGFSLEEEVVVGTYVRKRISFPSGPHDRVPAYLLIPRSIQGKVPGVLCLHQTTPLGKGEPAGLGGKESLHYAAHLAERGYVALAPDYPNFGSHVFDVYGRGYLSGSMKAIHDNVRAVDVLQSLPEVDPDRIGCIGHSLGGHNTLFTGVFDERIVALVSSCGFTAFPHYQGGNLAGWSSRTYMPRIPSYGGPRNMPFDFHEVVGALAPRPFLCIAPLNDDNFEVKGVKEVVESAREVYRLLGVEDRLEALYPDCGHDFPPQAREKAYAWLERWLRRPPAAVRKEER